jgi:hypothetical protein
MLKLCPLMVAILDGGQKCSLDGHIQDFVFGADRKSNMAARAHKCVLIGQNFINLLVRNH